MADLLFDTGEYLFSYRVAGILRKDDCVLLQQSAEDPGYAFPGGHVAFGETHAEALTREFREETGADIVVGALKWVAEVFFPWSGKPCQQICLFYEIRAADPGAPIECRDPGITLHWMPVRALNELVVYPPNAADLLKGHDAGVAHFVYRESPSS